MSRDMGRPKSAKNRHLPPRMSARKLASRTLYYYRTRNGGAIPLGADLAAAKLRWAQLETSGAITEGLTFTGAAERYERLGMQHLAVKTRKEYGAALGRLKVAFGHGTFEQIRRAHVLDYMDKRTAKIAGNREIAVLSALWNWCLDREITKAPNPCSKTKVSESPRGVYVTDEQYEAVYAQADQLLRDALDLARLTGQREADVLKMRRSDIQDGHLWVKQGKTGHPLGIALTGECGRAVEAMRDRVRSATGPYLVQTDAGQKMSYAMLRRRFDEARKAACATWQFRDLRAKAASDSGDLQQAQALLGHKSEATTAGVYRRGRGNKVRPVK